MDIQQLLAAILNPGGGSSQFNSPGPATYGTPRASQPHPPQAVQQVGDHNNPALLQQAMARFQQPQQAPPQAFAPQQAPQQQQMPQNAPQASPMPASAPQQQGGGFGGLGGILQNIIAPQSAQKNATIGWLRNQGLDSGFATVLASDKPSLRAYILDRSKGNESVFDQRAKAARDYGVDVTTPEGRAYVLTGSLGGDGAKPTSDIQNFQFAVNDGYKGSFAQWKKDNGSGVTVNLPGAPNIGTIPPGYAAKQDPATGAWTMEPIPGGPAAAQAAQDATKTANAADSKTVSTDVITGAASKIRDLAKEPGSTGIVGAGASYLPNTPAAEVYRQVAVLKSNATIENLNAMRAASPTGGALGNVTEGEGQMLAAKSGALDPKSPYFQQQLDDYEKTLLRVVHGKAEGDRIYDSTRKADAGPSRVNNPNRPAGNPDQTRSRPRAVNRKTGQTVEWDGAQWVPVQ